MMIWRTAADEGDGHGDDDAGVEADGRIDAGDDGKGDGLGDQGQGDDGPRQQVAARVGEPLLARGGDKGHVGFIWGLPPTWRAAMIVCGGFPGGSAAGIATRRFKQAGSKVRRA